MGIIIYLVNIALSLVFAVIIIDKLYISKKFFKDKNFHFYNELFSWEMFYFIIGIENIEVILADREFIGHEWLKFLYKSGVPFIIRIKDNSFVTYDCGVKAQASTIMRIVTPGGRWETMVSISGIPVRLAGTRSVNGNLVIVAASRSLSGDVLNNYRIRWLIELCFKSIKSQG